MLSQFDTSTVKKLTVSSESYRRGSVLTYTPLKIEVLVGNQV